MTDKTETPTSATDKTSRVVALFYRNRVMVYGVTSLVVFFLFARIVFWAVGWPWLLSTPYRILIVPFVVWGWVWFWIWFVDLRPRGFSLTLRHPHDDDHVVAAHDNDDHHDDGAA